MPSPTVGAAGHVLLPFHSPSAFASLHLCLLPNFSWELEIILNTHTHTLSHGYNLQLFF